jgi:hypothetical protein
VIVLMLGSSSTMVADASDTKQLRLPYLPHSLRLSPDARSRIIGSTTGCRPIA